jgi:CheY-like chemotaxis protein
MKQILFVEDDPMLRELYGMMLAKDSDAWKVSLAADGESALKLLEQNPFDVVVSDMKMPGMNGIQLLTDFQTDQRKNTPIHPGPDRQSRCVSQE